MPRLISKDRIELFFEKVDYLLTEQRVKVNVTQGANYSAYSHTWKKIMNLGVKATDTIDPIAKGLNYHELSHILYSAAAAGDHAVWNALEDGRIENIFVRRFPPAKGYFEKAVFDIILSKPKPEPEDFILLYPRRLYLSRPYHLAFEKVFETLYGPERTKRAKEIMDEFLLIEGKPEHTQKQKDLVDELSKLLGKNQVSNWNFSVRRVRTSKDPDDPNAVPEVEDASEQMEDIKEQMDEEEDEPEKDLDQAFGEPETEQEPEAERPEDGEDQGDLEPADIESEPEEGEDQEGEGEGKGDGESKDEESEDEGEGSGGKADESEEDEEAEAEAETDSSKNEPSDEGGATEEPPAKGRGGESDPTDILKKALEAMKQAADELADEQEIQAHIDAQVARNMEMWPEASQVEQAVTNLLRNYRLGNEPEMERHLYNGKFDLRSAMGADRKLDVFYKISDYSIGLDFNLAIAVDTSGSMGAIAFANKTMADAALDIAYGVARACDNMKCPTLVVQFESYAQVIKEADQREFKSLKAGHLGGGTTLQGALKIIGERLEKLSQANGKPCVVIVVSDSYWECNCGSRAQPGMCAWCGETCTKERLCYKGQGCYGCQNKVGVNASSCQLLKKWERDGWVVAPLVFEGTTHEMKDGRRVKGDLTDLHLHIKHVLDQVESRLQRGYA